MRATLALVVLAGCSDELCLPPLVHPTSIGVTEWQTTMFDVTLGQEAECNASVYIELSSNTGSFNGEVPANPDQVSLTKASPTATIVVTDVPTTTRSTTRTRSCS